MKNSARIRIILVSGAIFFISFVLAMLLLLQGSSYNAKSAPILQTEGTVISGTYVGTVVISEPVSIGTLDLSINIIENNGVISGVVEAKPSTLAFQGGTALQGTIIQSNETITPTFQITSTVFNDEVSDRAIERRFWLDGEVVKQGEVLQGQYTEIITGFTPAPMDVSGIFLLVRPPLPPK